MHCSETTLFKDNELLNVQSDNEKPEWETKVGAIKLYRANGTKVISLNARFTETVNKKLNKLAQLNNLAFSTESDIVAITETLLTEHVHNSEILGDAYSIYIRDKETGSRGCGILLAMKNTLNANLVFKDNESEIVVLSLTTRKCNNSFCYFVLCYR